MKKNHQASMAIYIVIAALTLTFVPAFPALAVPDSGIKVYLEDQQLSFTVPPQTINGRVMVPLRPIFEAMGAVLAWDQATSTATAIKGNTTVTVRIDDSEAFINGAVQNLDAPATAIDGCTLAPLRFVAEAFGNYVSWNSATQSAIISASPIPEPAAPVFKPEMFSWRGVSFGMTLDQVHNILGPPDSEGKGQCWVSRYGDVYIEYGQAYSYEGLVIDIWGMPTLDSRIYVGDSYEKLVDAYGQPTGESQWIDWSEGVNKEYRTSYGTIYFDISNGQIAQILIEQLY